MIADRDGSGTFDGGDLDSIAQCQLNLLETPLSMPSMEASECLLWRLCLTVDVRVNLELVDSPLTGRERIRFDFEGIERELSRGLLCDGGVDVPELDFFSEEAGRTEIFDILDGKLRDNTPGLDTVGLDLGGHVTFEKDRVIAIDTDGDPEFQDYVGITGRIIANPEP